jgi:hypothetical protein
MEAENFHELYQEYLGTLDEDHQNSVLTTDRANAEDVLWKFYIWLKENHDTH